MLWPSAPTRVERAFAAHDYHADGRVAVHELHAVMRTLCPEIAPNKVCTEISPYPALAWTRLVLPRPSLDEVYGETSQHGTTWPGMAYCTVYSTAYSTAYITAYITVCSMAQAR